MGSTQNKKEKEKEEKAQDEEKLFVYKEMVKKNERVNPEAHYKFLEKLGEGNYSHAFKAQSLSTGQYRVIKKI